MSCIKETISSAEPCLICGKPDYCYRLMFDDGSTLHCCARTESSSVFSNGKEYVFLKTKDSPIGTYFYYQEKTEKEENRKAYIEHLKASGQYQAGYIPKTTAVALGVTYTTVSSKKDTYISGECPVASIDRLDKVYNRLMQLLILEPFDLEKLKREWNSDITGSNFTDLILRTYPIKSLPPEDSKRSVLKRKILNRTRRSVCAQLYKEFGSLAGIPGFYQEDDDSWNLAGSEGMLFPCYKDGKMIRLRIRESYPTIQTTFNGVEGSMTHKISKTGYDLWFFTPKGCKDSELVWGNHVQKITLKKDGCPRGKASGKYKNLASIYAQKDEKGNSFNAYRNGTRSGSSISVYDKYALDFSVVYITEGEKKAMVANMILKVPVISLPGTGSFMKLFEPDENGLNIIDVLMIQKGLKLAVIAYDADKGENIRVLSAEQGAIAEFKKRQISIAIGEWNANFGKGLDDILVAGIMPSVYMCN